MKYSKAQTERALSYLKKQYRKGAILSPQEAKENLETNYTSAKGRPLRVGVGTLVKDPKLQGFRGSLPWTDASNTNAAVDKAAIHRDLDTAIRARKTLQDQVMPDADGAAPKALHGLKQGLENPTDINQEVAGNVRKAYEDVKKEGNALYEPLNKATIRLDQQQFPHYKASALELLNHRENVQNIFGDDNDLGQSVSRELDHADNLLSHKETYGLTLPETIQRSQQLGALARAAKNRSQFNVERLLTNLKDSLDTDVKNGLMQQGHGDLATQWTKANAHWAKHVVPYHGNSVLRKVVLYKHTPIKDELAKQLLDPNHDAQLNRLETPTKNGLVYQLITKGRGTSGGVANLTAEKIGSTYAQLPSAYKNQIARFNPTIDALFERTPAALEKNKAVLKAVADWDKKIEHLKAQKFGLKPSRYQTEMPPLPKHLGELIAMPFNPLGRARLSAYARFAVPWANQSWERVLTSPELREQYFQLLPAGLGKGVAKGTRQAATYKPWANALGAPLYEISGNQ